MPDYFAHTDEQTREDIERLRAMTLEERGKLFALACAAAARIERSRIESGLPPSQPAPWPQSTWDMLKRAAESARIQSQ